MQHAPKIDEIIEYIKKVQPLGIKEDFEIVDIDPKNPSGHWNFLIKQDDKKYVFRIIGNETPVVGGEIEKEYRILNYVDDYRVGPKVHFFDADNFIEPLLFEEYLDGQPLTEYSEEQQKEYFPGVARLIARINQIPLAKKIEPYLENKTSYFDNFKKWRERLRDISKDARCDEWRKKIEDILPAAENILNERFARVLQKTKKVFIFESAHVGHCFVSTKGLCFINWEQISFGDPSFSLAVFLASVENRNDFEELKKKMMEEYLRVNPVSNFVVLVHGRLFERAVSNCIWVLWAYVLRKDPGSPDKASGVARRLENIKKLCNMYS